MNKLGHLFIGSVLGIALVLLTHYYLGWFTKDLLNVAIIIWVIYVYSLLPDIDSKSGSITWTFIAVAIVALISGYFLKNNIFLIFGIGLITITFLAAEFMPHRGFTHSILFGILVSFPWIYIDWHYSILSFVCFYSHLLADQEYFKII